jgi:hypothetical protein
MKNAAEKDTGPKRENRSPTASRQWQVLFIGDHGKVVAFRRIKALIGLAIGVLMTALVTVIVLVAVNARMHSRMQKVQEHLSAAQLQVQALHRERDLLNAHIILVETKMKETLAGLSPSGIAKKTDSVVAGEKAIEPPGPPPAAASQSASPAAEPTEEIRTPVGIEEVVAVENFYAGWVASRQALHLRYKLVAARSARKPVAGHVVVVFKGPGIEPDRWLAMPRVDLPRGRPSGRQKGYTFAINHSKSFSHFMTVATSLPKYTQAVLYVFSHQGELLMARDYGVDLKPAGD